MNDIITIMDEIQAHVFQYQISQLSDKIIIFVENLTLWVEGLAGEQQIVVMPVLEAILRSYENKDYLLLADLLEFELKPLLNDKKVM